MHFKLGINVSMIKETTVVRPGVCLATSAKISCGRLDNRITCHWARMRVLYLEKLLAGRLVAHYAGDVEGVDQLTPLINTLAIK